MQSIDRRSVLSGATAGLLGMGAAPPPEDSIVTALKQAVGAHSETVGMVGAVVDESGTRIASYGSAGAPGVALDGDTVFEIMSITKIFTALLLADMVTRG